MNNYSAQSYWVKYIIMLTIGSTCLLPSMACQSQTTTNKSTHTMAQSPQNTMVHKLMNNAYGDFFNYLERDQAINRAWNEPNSLEKLKNIVSTPSLPLKARFLACEVLFEKHFTFVADVGGALVAKIYADALVNNQTGMANSWGFLYEQDDAGPTGIRFSMIGKSSVPYLEALLDNNQRTLLYAGSKEATIGNAYQYRIKDFAAFYLSKITLTPITFYQDMAKRDAEIERFKKELAKN